MPDINMSLGNSILVGILLKGLCLMNGNKHPAIKLSTIFSLERVLISCNLYDLKFSQFSLSDNFIIFFSTDRLGPI